MNVQHHGKEGENGNPSGRMWEPKKIERERENIQVKRAGFRHHFPDQVGRNPSLDSKGDTKMRIHTGLKMIHRAAV